MIRRRGGSRWARGWRRAGAEILNLPFWIFDWRRSLTILGIGLLMGCVSKTTTRDYHDSRETVKLMGPASQPARGPRAILYQRRGGIAGTDDRVVIWPDGMVTVRGKL